MVGGRYVKGHGENATDALLTTAEETVETIGVAVVLHALVAHAARTVPAIRLLFRER
jgi:transcriptional/translational regulatory protein YebC/TACO1